MFSFMSKSLSKSLHNRIRVAATATIALAALMLGSCFLLDALGNVDDYEPNDSIAQAHLITLGESYTAYIAEDDADFFSFQTAHGSGTFDEVEISVTNVGSDLRIGIAVYDPSGELIFSRTTNTKGADLTVVLTDLQSDDAYYVRFSGTWGITGWAVDSYGDYDTQGPYTFTVRNLDANDDFAGNHSIDDAEPISIGETYNGVLVSKYEKDFFSFTATSEDMEFVITNVGPDLNIGVVIHSALGQIGYTYTTPNPGMNPTLTISDFIVEQTYYVRFNGTWGQGGWEVDESGDNDSKGPYTFAVNAL